MLVNSDFSLRAEITPDQYRWTASPQAGVERMMLDRVGGEQARATSIVRYARASRFPRHEHPLGEEILVLSGTFSDEERDYGPGWYLRNPPGSSHEPSSRDGATIFVKLQQMPSDEAATVRIDTADPARWQAAEGRAICPLFSDAREQVALHRLAPAARLFAGFVEGAEVLVLHGALLEDGRSYPTGSWIRIPAGVFPAFVGSSDGATLYLKTGRVMAQTEWEGDAHA